jgi:hypothetical protein
MVVVTGRRRLIGLAAAHGARLLALDTPSTAEATAGFLRRVGSTHPVPDPAAVEEIVARCGRLPLALAVVAARALSSPERSLTRLAGELAATQGRLDGFSDFEEGNGLREIFSWSYRRLGTEARRVFSFLASLPLLSSHRTADFTTAALAELADISWHAAAAAAGELVHARLLDVRKGDRYSVHSLVLAYAAELDCVRGTEHTHAAGVRAPTIDTRAVLGLVVGPPVPVSSDMPHAPRLPGTRDRPLLSTLAS